MRKPLFSVVLSAILFVATYAFRHNSPLYGPFILAMTVQRGKVLATTFTRLAPDIHIRTQRRPRKYTQQPS